MSGYPTGSWDEASAARLTVLRNSGMSCTFIAKMLRTEFRRHFTRNSVIGKCSRLGLKVGEVSPPMIWTAEKLAEAEIMYRRGDGARTIAAELGVPLGAVYVKADYKGWTSPNSKGKPKAKVPRQKKHSPEVVAAARAKGEPLPPRAGPRTVDPQIALAPRPWTTREPSECSYPVDGIGADVRSCCNPVDRRGLCTGHAAICLTTGATDEQIAAAKARFKFAKLSNLAIHAGRPA